MTPEGKVKKKVLNLLISNGAYYCMPVTGGYGRSGVPDIIACLNGKFLAIECKAGDNKITALQDKALADIQKAGGSALVINEDGIKDLEFLIKFIKGESKNVAKSW